MDDEGIPLEIYDLYLTLYDWQIFLTNNIFLYQETRNMKEHIYSLTERKISFNGDELVWHCMCTNVSQLNANSIEIYLKYFRLCLSFPAVDDIPRCKILRLPNYLSQKKNVQK